MPQWLCNQLMRAFYKKDVSQIKMLNECWFFYRNRGSVRAGTTDREAKQNRP